MTTEAAQAITQLRPGDHVCLLYETQAEYLASLSLFHRNGLAGGARCIHVADNTSIDTFLDTLRCTGVEVDREIEKGSLQILTPQAVYLRNGVFDPNAVVAFWQQASEDARKAGFSGLCVTGDMTWVRDNAPGAERLGEYEAKINQAIPGTCMQAICCYSRRLFPAVVLASIFRTHPRVIFGDEIMHPDLLVCSSQNGKPSQDWLEVLLRRLRQSEDALRDALDIKERLLETSPAAIYTCDAEGRITSFNQMAAQFWGREPKIGDPDERFCGSFRLFWPDGRLMPHSETPMALAIREGKPCENGEVIIERPDGSLITVLVSIVPLKDTQGRVTGAINHFVYITGRKQAEAMLRQRTHDYYLLLENLPAAAYTCDAEGLITYFNPYAVQVWGREPKLNDPRDRFCGSFRLYLPDGSPIRHDQCWMALALQTGQAQHGCEIVIERPDGSRATALAHAHPFLDEQGKLIGAVNVLVDISDHKQAEMAKARLAAIVESAEDAVVSKDLDGVITSWNRGAERIFGYTPQEAIGQPVTMLMPPDRVDEEPGILERIRRGESIEHYETVRRRKDGTLLDISLTVSPIIDGRGQIVGASKIARDITERKRSEKALMEADRQKDRFLAMLSHELRNPLAPIANAVDLLRLSQDHPSVQQEALSTLDRQVNTLTRLVNDLLDVSRVTTGRIQLQQMDVDLNSLVLEVAKSFRPQMEEWRHEFSVSISGTPLWVHGDPTRLEQVVVNLLSNASKYTPEGGQVRLTVAREGDEAVVRVKDTGVGMDAQLLSHVFELFSQGDRTLDRTQSGLGIGLSLVKSLVEMHGGKVTARSEGHGKGSEFIVRLPTVQPPVPQPVASPGDSAEPAAHSLRVLLVDDNPDTRNVFGRLLEILGHQVRTAHDGPSALEAALDFRPDVVLLDIGLPGMSGYEVAQRMRQEAMLQAAVLISVTGYGQQSDRQHSQEAGFDHHLVKPLDIDEVEQLLAAIRKTGTLSGVA